MNNRETHTVIKNLLLALEGPRDSEAWHEARAEGINALCELDDDYDPSPVNSWEVTEGVSAAERDELAWRQKSELDRG